MGKFAENAMYIWSKKFFGYQYDKVFRISVRQRIPKFKPLKIQAIKAAYVYIITCPGEFQLPYQKMIINRLQQNLEISLDLVLGYCSNLSFQMSETFDFWFLVSIIAYKQV